MSDGDQSNLKRLRMLNLHTLGGVYVTRDAGPPLGGPASQRKLLGLLAVLAASGDAGMSRDRLVSLLWPEGDSDKGRHSLTQALYHARRILDCDALFLSGSDVRLNPEALSSDVRELDLALATGDRRRAAALYSGSFLEDFYIPGNLEFERWSESLRRRLAEKMERAFDELAADAAKTGAADHEIEWRRRRLALDPLNTAAAARLVETVAATGDRLGALRHAHVHQTLLRTELEIEPATEFRALVARLEARASETAFSPVELSAAGGKQHTSAPPSIDTHEPSSERITSRWRTRQVRTRLGALVIGAVIVLTVVIGLLQRTEPTPRLNTPVTAHSVVVVPFRVSGADPSLRFLRVGLVELLSIRLETDSAARAVDAGAVLSAWRRTRAADSTDIDRAGATRFAEELGASGVVVGSVVGDARHLLITASLIDVRERTKHVTAFADGPVDSLASVVDRLAGRLLLASAGEGERFVNRVTPSLDALRAYLSGQEEYRRGHFDDAVRHYERALSIDSTFALAALRLALVADRRNAAEQHDRALSVAWANRGELTERDKLHLTALAGPRYPEPSTEAEQLSAWEAAVALSPDRAEVLTELAERLVQSGRLLGAIEPERRAESILRRALELEPDENGARQLLVLLAAQSGNVADLTRSLGPRAGRGSGATLASFLRWRVAQATANAAELRRLRVRFANLDDADLRAIGMASQFDAVGVEDGERALRIRGLRARTAGEVLDATLAQHSLALNQGRPILALDLTELLQDAQPGSRAHLRLRVLDALYGGGNMAAAERAAFELTRFADAAPMAMASTRAIQLADACVLSQWRLAHGEIRKVRRAIVELRAAGLPRDPVPVGANPHTCAELLDASVAVNARAPDAAARVARVDSLMLGGASAGDAAAYAHIVVARLYDRIGQPSRALDAIRRRAYMNGWPRYLVTALRDEGRLAMLAGDRTAALSAYRRYLALRSAPESPVATEVAEVRSAIEEAGRQ